MTDAAAVKHQYIPQDDYEKNGWKPFGQRREHFCTACKRYYAKLKAEGITSEAFPVHCRGDVRRLIPTREELGCGQDEYDEMRVLADPILFGRAFFDIEARWYQTEPLCCTADKKVMRAGRRIGKSYALVWYILWYAWTHAGHNVLVIAPYQAQVTKLFNDMKKLIGASPEMSEVAQIRSTPPLQISFPNGTTILGFASGKNSSQHSDQIRGQDAHLIALDEVDLMNDYDLEVISAIMVSHPDMEIVACSTPKGWRRFFYRHCTDKSQGFKEFHYISAESPSWTEKTERYFRGNFSKTGYEHEFLAEFGEPEEGVFSVEAIDASLREYKLEEYEVSSGTHKILGVDWNAAYGTHITLVEYVTDPSSPFFGKFALAAKEVIPKSEFSQHRAVEAVKRLNQTHDPDYIYVDHGFGDVQIEMLKMAGLEDPSSELYEKLRPIRMGGQIMINEPGTGLEENRLVKPYMVGVAAVHVEEGRCVFPVSEDTDVVAEPGQDNAKMGLIQQMRNFRVVRLSQAGQPVYSQDYEHTLTAWMLAILGFQLEYGGLRGQDVAARVVVGGQFGSALEEEKAKSGGFRQEAHLERPLAPRARTGRSDETEWKDGWMRIDAATPSVVALPSYLQRSGGRGGSAGSRGRFSGISRTPIRRRT